MREESLFGWAMFGLIVSSISFGSFFLLLGDEWYIWLIYLVGTLGLMLFIKMTGKYSQLSLKKVIENYEQELKRKGKK